MRSVGCPPIVEAECRKHHKRFPKVAWPLCCALQGEVGCSSPVGRHPIENKCALKIRRAFVEYTNPGRGHGCKRRNHHQWFASNRTIGL
jgi:hypothetical protein